MTDSMPTVSVIIPARDAADSLPRALEAIAAQTYSNIVEVIVAAADPATAASAIGVTVVENPTGRTPAGLNMAIDSAAGDVVVRCDAHAVLPATYVERAIETLLRTGAANVGGMQVPVGRTALEKAIAAAMRSPLGAGDARYRVGGEEGPVETVYLGVFERDVLVELDGFDDSFWRAQDYELNHRIIESGRVVWFDPQLKVDYTPRGSLRALWLQYFDYGRAKRRMAGIHPGSLRWRQVAPPVGVVGLAVSLALTLVTPWAALAPAAYAVALLGAGAAESGANAAVVALAMATMHISWGTGFLRG